MSVLVIIVDDEKLLFIRTLHSIIFYKNESENVKNIVECVTRFLNRKELSLLNISWV